LRCSVGIITAADGEQHEDNLKKTAGSHFHD
jgi:hypothetical protein